MKTTQIIELREELASLLKRHSELEAIEPAANTDELVRQLVSSGKDPKKAVAEAQEKQAAGIAAEMELTAVSDRLAEVFDALRNELAPLKEQLTERAEKQNAADLKKWMKSGGDKFDEKLRERLFIFSSDSDASIQAMNEASAVPSLSTREFQWRTMRAVRPSRDVLNWRGDAVTHASIEQNHAGVGVDSLTRLLDQLQAIS